MADSSEKTEDPTGKKLEDARKKGQLARSRELSTTLVLIVSAFMFLLVGGWIAE
ncbi:MAG: EscU/YscU/HrcU family type III secretion system export apparatus switch protein, partial [Pseudomonadota bacterium]|nr:EscU/YscU/HrcU family type III secretion system export apparatus switch protein [Pseudomonadota bacterium]